MNIGGLNTMTLLDYPGKVAATVFTKGCNFCCPFCQNADLVLNGLTEKFSENEVLDFLKRRKKLLDGVCISGGEPSLQPDLAEFIYKIKSIGYLVKLDTNGYKPSVIKTLYEGHLIDYVAMDYKAPLEKYNLASGLELVDSEIIKESVDYIMNCGIEYEFRTTLVKGIHEKDDMLKMAKELKGAKAYFLQSYKDSDRIISKVKNGKTYDSFSIEELNSFAKIIKEYVPSVIIRGE